MARSLGVNTFQLAKKLVDRVISVRCHSTFTLDSHLTSLQTIVLNIDLTHLYHFHFDCSCVLLESSLFLFLSGFSEEDSLVAMLRFQEFERSTVDTEGAMGLAAILAGQLPELRGKKWVRHVTNCSSLQVLCE